MSWGVLLSSQHFGGRGACWRFGMGLRRLISNLITHRDLHKPNNKMVSAQLQHFGARTHHGQTRTPKTHHSQDLGEATTFHLIVYFVPGHRADTQMSFVPGLPNGSFKIPKVEILATLGVHNFVCKPLIKMRSKAKLQPSSRSFQWYVTRYLHARKSGRFLTFSDRFDKLTLNFSFGHNLCLKCLNGSSEPTLDI